MNLGRQTSVLVVVVLSRIVAVAPLPLLLQSWRQRQCQRVAESHSCRGAEVVAVRPGHAVRQTLQVAFPVAMAYT